MQRQGKYSPLISLLILISGIATAHIITEILLHNYNHFPDYFVFILGSIIMTVIVFPVLYFFSIRPLLFQIKQRQQSERILQSRLRLVQQASTHTIDELLQITLDEIESINGSKIGFFHLLEADQETIRLHSWSSNTLQSLCDTEGKDSHKDLKQAGVWAEAIRERRPLIHNDYVGLAGRKGLPGGHTQIIREVVVPILRDHKVVAVLGLGNKAQDYTAEDVEVISAYGDFAWDVVDYLQAQIAIQKSEEKFRTLADWTYDWELWVDTNGNIGYISPSCERITGYTPVEFIADPNLLMHIIHPTERQMMEDHQVVMHEASGDPITLEYRILARDGSEHWIEHICRPLFGANGQHLGRRISNRDITRRKQAEKKILEQTQKEVMLTQTIRTLQTDIGRDLHDTLGNHISFLRMNLEHLSEAESVDSITIKSQLQNMTKAANEAYEMIRAMLAILQTENFDDPPSLFYHYADQIVERSTFQCELTSKGDSRQLSLAQLRQLFYIFREALGNIEKHANAKHVYGEFIWGDETLTLNMSDDGTGFDPESVQTSGHFGLKFMRERTEQMKGSFYIRSLPGKGTTVTVVIPYESGSASQSLQ
jgi:PAS domain S-box-containing protein